VDPMAEHLPDGYIKISGNSHLWIIAASKIIALPRLFRQALNIVIRGYDEAYLILMDHSAIRFVHVRLSYL